MNLVLFIKKYAWALVLIMIIVWGGYLRFFQLGQPSLWIDEGFTLLAAQGIEKTGKPILPSGVTYTAHPASTYITALSQKIFGADSVNPWSARLPHALFGTLLIGLIFVAIYSTTKNIWLSLFITALFAFFEWNIAWSRQIRGYAMMQSFLVLGYIFIYRFHEHKKYRYLLYATLATILAILSQGVAMVMLPVLLLVLVYSVYFQSTIGTGHLRSLIMKRNMIALGGVILLSAIAYYLWIPAVSLSGFHGIYLSFFWEKFNVITVIGIITILGILILKKPLFKNASLFIPLIWIMIPGIIITWFSHVVQFRYYLVIIPFLFIFLASCIAPWDDAAQKFFRRSISGKITLGIIILFCLTFFGTFIPKSDYLLESGSPQSDFKGAYHAIQKKYNSDSVILTPYPYMNQIYLGTPGLWLPISMTRNPAELEQRILPGNREYYTGTPIIESKEQLKNILTQNDGFIMLDHMAASRVTSEWIDMMLDPMYATPIYKNIQPGHEIIVFQFPPNIK